MKNILSVFLVTMMCGGVAFAECGCKHGHKDMANMTKEDRDKMAAMHEKLATCLRSDPAKECHEEMAASREEMGMGCMMGKHGKGHGKGMKSSEQKSEKK